MLFSLIACLYLLLIISFLTVIPEIDKVIFSLIFNPLHFLFLYLRSVMGRETRSSSFDSSPTFTVQSYSKIRSEKSAHLIMPTSQPSDHLTSSRTEQFSGRLTGSPIRRVVYEWLCFLAFPFTLGLRFLFSDFIMDFFCTTGLSFSQIMPMVWRVLVILDRIKNNHLPDLCVNDLPVVYRLRSHRSSRFLLYSTSKNPLILRATQNEEEWKTKFFFVKRSSIPGGKSFPVKWLTKGRS
ncbi:hypothetical protein HanPI659440_Chr06g0240581 [Helianthus annuus]|nr:hypothetical protein HanPI659440_Chr06g0240581 [Helianthus annuus]